MNHTKQSEAMHGERFAASDTPSTIDGVEIAVFEGEAVLFDEATSMLHRLGAIAGGVWLYCDGTTDVATMIDDLAETFQVDGEEMAGAVHDTLGRFADEGLLVGHDAPIRMTSTAQPVAAADGTPILTRPPDP